MREEVISCEPSRVFVVGESVVGHNIVESFDKGSRFVRRRTQTTIHGNPSSGKSVRRTSLKYLEVVVIVIFGTTLWCQNCRRILLIQAFSSILQQFEIQRASGLDSAQATVHIDQ